MRWTGKKINRLALAALSACLALGRATASGALTVQDLQDKMSEADRSIASLRFEYSQKVTSSLTPEVKKSSGRAFFRKPSQLRIEQSEPEAQLIVGVGKNVYIYTPRFKQVLKDSWKKWSSSNFLFPGLASFGQTLDKLKQEYVWEVLGSTSAPDGDPWILVRLHRKGAAPGSEDVNLWLGESDFLPRKTELVMGTLTLTTEVTSLTRNPVLADDIFKFRKPADAQMIQVP